MIWSRELAATKAQLKTTRYYLNLALLGYCHAQIRHEYEEKYGSLPPDPYRSTEGDAQ